ncbi:MAG TPA: AsmA family protein [Saliniramus sp.]|nr:AsmA family protein [Saliniramus sp.]
MNRILKFTAAIIVLAGIVMALAPWTVSSRALTDRVAQQLETELGFDLKVGGRTVIAFLPVPRIKFENVSIHGADGAPLSRGGELRAQLAAGPLLLGQIMLDEVSLSNSRVDIVIDDSGRSPWDPVVSALNARLEDEALRPSITRMALLNAQVFHHDVASDKRTIMRNVDLTGTWNNPGGAIEIGGVATIRGEAIQIALTEFNPSLFVSNQRSPLELRLNSRLGRLTIVGSLSTGEASPWLIGRSTFETSALRDLLIWSGQRLPLGPLISSAGLDGEISGVGGVVSWPSLRVTLGSDRLDGALTARMENGRLSLNGTLAADTLNLDEFAAPFREAATAAGPWRYRSYDLASTTGADLDLRLSASTARVGGLRLGDVAMSVLVKEGRIEAGISRATLNGGPAKGRLSIAAHEQGLELRGQGEAERVDVAALIRDVTGSAWMGGEGVVKFALESRGASAAELARRAEGQADLEVVNGQFIGIALDDALRRFERQPLTTSMNLRSGSTPFERARTTIVLGQSVAQLVETGFETPSLRGIVEGAFLLPDRRLAARAAIESKTPVGEANMTSALAFDIQGPWNNISVIPDAKALIQRSGAARLLLAPSREAEVLPQASPTR